MATSRIQFSRTAVNLKILRPEEGYGGDPAGEQSVPGSREGKKKLRQSLCRAIQVYIYIGVCVCVCTYVCMYVTEDTPNHI
jgi:hypothetical protein